MEIIDVAPTDILNHDDSERCHQVVGTEKSKEMPIETMEVIKTECLDSLLGGLSEEQSMDYDNNTKTTIATMKSQKTEIETMKYEKTQCFDLSMAYSPEEASSAENENLKNGVSTEHLQKNTFNNLESQIRATSSDDMSSPGVVSCLEQQESILSSEVILVSEESVPVAIKAKADGHVSETIVGDGKKHSPQMEEIELMTHMVHKIKSNEQESNDNCKKENTNLAERNSENKENVIEGQDSSNNLLVSFEKGSDDGKLNDRDDVDNNEVICMNENSRTSEPGFPKHIPETIVGLSKSAIQDYDGRDSIFVKQPISVTTDALLYAGLDDIIRNGIVSRSENDATLIDNDHEKLRVTIYDLHTADNDTPEKLFSGATQSEMHTKLNNKIETQSCVADKPDTKELSTLIAPSSGVFAQVPAMSDGFQLKEQEILVKDGIICDESVINISANSETSPGVTCTWQKEINVPNNLSEPVQNDQSMATSAREPDIPFPNNTSEIDENDRSMVASAGELDIQIPNNLSETDQNDQCNAVFAGEHDTHIRTNISEIDRSDQSMSSSAGKVDRESQEFCYGTIRQDVLRKPEEEENEYISVNQTDFSSHQHKEAETNISSVINEVRCNNEINESDTPNGDMHLIREPSDETDEDSLTPISNEDSDTNSIKAGKIEESKLEADQTLQNNEEKNALCQESRAVIIDNNECQADQTLLNKEEHYVLFQESTQTDSMHSRGGVSYSTHEYYGVDNTQGPSMPNENEFLDSESSLLHHSDRFVSARMRSDSLDSDIFEDARESLETCSLFSCNDISDDLLDTLQSPPASKTFLRSTSTNSNKGTDVAFLRSLSINSNKGTGDAKTKLDSLLHKDEDPELPKTEDLKAPAPEAWQEFANSPNEEKEKEQEKEAAMMDISAKAKEDKPMKFSAPLKSLLANDVPVKEVLKDTKDVPSPRKAGKLKMKFMWSNCICCRDVH